MTSEYTAGQVPDIYGQVHPVESPELIQSKLAEFQTQLDALPTNPNIVNAKEKGLHSDQFVLQFLRCDVFNTDKAVARYVRYWDKRVEIFGPELAFMPITLQEACQHDRVALEQGVVRVVDMPEPDKRTYLFIEPSKQDPTKYSRESMLRAAWYFAHRILEEDELVQKKGMFAVDYAHGAKLRNFDKQMVLQVLETIQGCFPVRNSAIHLCHPPWYFRLLFPVIIVFVSERMRKRFKLHMGSREHVLERLAKYGFTRADLPTEIGGDRVVDVKAWLAEREKAGK